MNHHHHDERAGIEPEATGAFNPEYHHSQAISLKRIADALERLRVPGVEARQVQTVQSMRVDEAGFAPAEYAHIAQLIRVTSTVNDQRFHAALANNFNIILAALDRCSK